MNDILSEIFTTGEVSLPDGRRVAIHSGITLQSGRFLQEVITAAPPKVTLEIGLAFGISALFICQVTQSMGAERHIVIDPNQNQPGPWGDCWQGIGLQVLHRAGFSPMIELHERPSYSILPRLEEAGTRVDLAFVDGWHTFDYCMADFILIDRILNVNGILILNDTHWPSIRKVCRYILTNRSYSVFRCLTTPHEPESLERERQASLGVGNIPRHLRKLLRPEAIETDEELGISPRARCIAFRKEREDIRAWDFHEEF